MPKLLDFHAAAAYVGCSIWSLRDAVWDARLPFVKMGRKHFLAVEDLDAMIESLKTYEGTAKKTGQIAGKASKGRAKAANSAD